MSPGRFIKKKVEGLTKEKEFRCEFCGHLLAKGSLEKGSIEFLCRKCRKLNTFVTMS
jgi:phage FluMu protein Com